MRFSEIDAARKLLELGEAASLEQVQHAYRTKAHLYHPDKNDSAHTEQMKEINAAYELLTGICKNYKYIFCKEDLARAFSLEEDLDVWRDKWAI